jgi:DNA-binding transcriptional regulator LsrR (DeoR family)
MTQERDRLRLITRVARMYHEQGIRQPEIAARLSLSQARVSRLLKEAAERGIVRTVVVPPVNVHSDLEDLLIDKYGLRDAVVIDVSGTSEEVLAGLGSGAASYLETALLGGDVIGVSSWSATLLTAIEMMGSNPAVGAKSVVQLVGGVGSHEVQMQATLLTGRMAEVTGATPHFVPAPGLVGSRKLQEALMEDPGMEGVHTEWAALTVTLVGIGTLEPSPLLRRSGNSLTSDEQAELERRGAVGDVCLRYFDGAGQPVSTSFDQRIIGVDRETLLKPARRIGIAGGIEKVAAIEAAMLGGWVNIVVTDLDVARRLTNV